MGFNCGIVGLPNVGKSTLFNAITKAGAKASNFPFCTIDPNVGIVNVPDARLLKLAELVTPERIVHTNIEFVDIAGLVKGASKGEGLGNKFLSHIRQVDAIAHIVRCFDDDNIIHVDNKISPVDDIETIHTELILSDLETLERRLRTARKLRNEKGMDEVLDVYERTLKGLEEGSRAIQIDLNAEEREHLYDLHLLTNKKTFYVANVGEEDILSDNNHVKVLKEYLNGEDIPVVKICGNIESEIAELEGEEKMAFLSDYGLKESGLDKMIRAGYDILHLITYFTAGVKEVRAWTVKKGSLAPNAAGVIHTDFERGFIKAEVIAFNDFINSGSEAKAKEKGLMRLEGKEYLVCDGDVMHFKFNV